MAKLIFLLRRKSGTTVASKNRDQSSAGRASSMACPSASRSRKAWRSPSRHGSSGEWPVQHFSYEDEDLQRISEDVALTFAEFAACDKRHARFFVTVPRSDWNEALVPASEFLALVLDQMEGDT